MVIIRIMDIKLKEAHEITKEAIKKYNPYAIVAMVSGGDDSLTALNVASDLGVKIDFILHGITGTGVQSTTDHVRKMATKFDAKYIEADAGNKYEKYVARKGFFGVGDSAHSFAYHVLKQQHFEAALSKHIRQGKRGRKILLLNGARKLESKNRRMNIINPIMPMGTKKPRDKNIWVSLIHGWSKRDCMDYLKDSKIGRCPAAVYCHRSGECMCGTMQTKEQGEEIAYWFPDWGQWWHDIREVGRGHGFDWGEDYPPNLKAIHEREKQKAAGQLDIFDDWLPMCQSCQT